MLTAAGHEPEKKWWLRWTGWKKWKGWKKEKKTEEEIAHGLLTRKDQKRHTLGKG